MIRVLLLALLLLGSGCSVRMAYNNLDRLARWSVSDYIDLSDTQRACFDAAFDRLWRWHRAEHLPQYAGFLQELRGTLGDGIDEAEMRVLVDRVVAWADEIEQQGLPAAAALLASLSDAQVARLAEALEARNRELAEPEQGVSLVRAQRGWQEEFTGRFTEFSGRLTRGQREYLARQSARYVPELVMWADYRRRWQRDLLALLAHRDDRAAFTRGFAELSAQRERYYGTELAAVVAGNERLAREASAWLVNHLTARQRERFFRRLDDLAEDLQVLSRQPGPPPRGEAPASC